MKREDFAEDHMKMTCFIKDGMGLERKDIDIVLDNKFNRKHHPSYEESIDKTWNERLKSQQTIYNAIKFRYHSAEEANNGIKLRLNFGLTGYKSFVGTNLSNDEEKLSFLKMQGSDNYSDESAYFAMPVGVGALLRTDDNHFVYMRRSQLCAEGQGIIDRPGGHPEPDVLMKKFGTEDHKSLYQCKSADVLEEIFESIRKEIRDEINITMDLTSEPLLMGIAFDSKLAERPSFEFYVRCSLTKEQVLECYKKGDQAEKFESENLIVLSEQEILDSSQQKNDTWKQYGPAAKAAIFMYQRLSEEQRKL